MCLCFYVCFCLCKCLCLLIFLCIYMSVCVCDCDYVSPSVSNMFNYCIIFLHISTCLCLFLCILFTVCHYIYVSELVLSTSSDFFQSEHYRIKCVFICCLSWVIITEYCITMLFLSSILIYKYVQVYDQHTNGVHTNYKAISNISNTCILQTEQLIRDYVCLSTT